MTVDFKDYFWGEKNLGFDVLYHNMKHGLVASKELSEFFRERSNVEEFNSKQMTKLAKQAATGCPHGTFSPIWQVLKASSERLAALHTQMMQRVSELVKDVSKYADDLHKKYKAVKENESGTLEIVQAIQSTTVTLQKAKDLYAQKSIELERLRKENASLKDVEKAEAKLRKLHDEYRVSVEKYAAIKDDFEKKMTVTCRHFQDIEEAHLKRMKDFLNSYSEAIENNHDLVGQVHTDFRRQCSELSVDKLLEQFVLNKYTGLEKPSTIEIEELNLPSPTSGTDVGGRESFGGDATVADGFAESLKPPKREGFLRSRRDKAKLKKVKKKNTVEILCSKDDLPDTEDTGDALKSALRPVAAEPGTPEKDDEGFCVQPKVTELWRTNKDNFYSSSDTDSDDERERKIRVEIKPLSNGTAPMSASVDELRATVENISLMRSSRNESSSNADVRDPTIKRSQSVSQRLGGVKASDDLLGLNLFRSPVASNASTPTGGHPYAPLRSPPVLQSPTRRPVPNSPTPSSSRYPGGDISSLDLEREIASGRTSIDVKPFDTNELFEEVSDGQSTVPKTVSRQTPTPTSSSIALPRPPSRRSDSSRGRISPGPMSRADSVGSLEFRAAGVLIGASRGPSPLTIGMADTIPLAVAFHEIVHSYFRGSDETMCQVRMSGDMMLSFPAGIVAVLANNPSPAKLVFRLRNARRLESVIPNKQLVSIDLTRTNTDSMVLDFAMPALNALLKRQAEQNPSASYFNVDILKYRVKSKPGAGSCPFQLVAYWKCVPKQTDLKIDYKYNSHAMANPSPLLNVMVSAPIDGGVRSFQTKPPAQWSSENERTVWSFTELSQHSENDGVGSIRARFEIDEGPSTPSTVSTQFNCEGTTLSGVEFELIGSGYRLSLVKRRFVSGKYICDGDSRQSKGTPSSSADDSIA